MPTVTNSCDEEECPQNLHKYPWCTTLSYSHGYFCSFFIELNTLASGTMTFGSQLSESEWQSNSESLSTSPLFACCWTSFEAVLGNKEFEFVVSEVTLIVVTRHSASGHGVSVLVSMTGRVHLIPLFKNLIKKSKISSGNSCNYCINNVQALGLRVLKKNSLTPGKPCLENRELIYSNLSFLF